MRKTCLKEKEQNREDQIRIKSDQMCVATGFKTAFWHSKQNIQWTEYTTGTNSYKKKLNMRVCVLGW